MGTPKYTFTQTLRDITVTIPLDPPIRAKLLDVTITPTTVRATRKLQNTDALIDGDLFASVDVDGSTWTVEDQKELVLTLEKRKQEWWPHIVTTDEKIDTTKLEPENSRLEDLDSETRATVEKMMFDQQQKQLGKPTSEELKKKQMLEKFKTMHPELDFSQVKADFSN